MFTLNGLLLEEVFKCSARVGWPRGGISVLLLAGGGRGGSNRRRVLFNGHPDFEEFAIILRTLLQYRLGDRLRAFPLGARIEVDALFAAMQLKTALGARAIGIKAGGQDAAAARTSGMKHRANHPGCTWTNLFLARGTRTILLLLFALFRFAGILITVLFVFSIQTDLQGAFTLRCGLGPDFPRT